MAELELGWSSRLVQLMGRYGPSVELTETVKLASPIVLTQLGQVAMMTTDSAFIGRLGVQELGAAELAGRFYLLSVTLGVGLLAAITPVAAQAFGSAHLTVLRHALRMGIWAALIVSFPIIGTLLQGEQILLTLGQAPDVARLAGRYLYGLAWGVLPTLLFLAIRSFMCAVNQPQPVLWITLAAIPVNALLVYMLIYGEFGLPRLELFGAGLATSLAESAAFLAIFWFATSRQPFRDYYVFAHLWRFERPVMWQLIAIGTPISIAFFVEVGLFWAASLLAGLISASALTAHLIAAQVASILFLIYFGIGMAAAVRVAYAVGQNDGPAIKRAHVVAIRLAVAMAAILTLAVIVGRFEIVELFLDKSATDPDETVGLSARALVLGGGVFISSSAQCVAAGCLRGMKDTRIPLLFAGAAYWLIGFPLSYVLGLNFGLGVTGIWVGLSIGMTVYAGLLEVRFRLLLGRLALQSRNRID